MKSNLYTFPVLKKQKPLSKDEITSTDIDQIVEHYSIQLVENLNHHGFEINDRFLRDFEFVIDFLESSLCRNIGKHHTCQDYIDDVDEFIDNLDKEETEEVE